MRKNIDLIVNGIKPEKVMYDTDNHSLVVLYPEQKEFKVGDKVRLKKNLDLMPGYNYGNVEYTRAMDYIKDAILTVKRIGNFTGSLELKCTNNINNDWWWYSSEWLEHIIEDDNEVKFKKGDILVHDDTLLIFDEYSNGDRGLLHSLWNNRGIDNKNWKVKPFEHATDEQKAQVYELLKKDGKKWNAETLEIEGLDISEIAFNSETACEYLNKTIPNFSSLFTSLSFENYYKYYAQIALQLICEAWNKFDGFVVDWDDYMQPKYYPVLDANELVKYYTLSNSKHICSACYSFQTSERAIQFGNQFKELLKTAMGI